MNLYKSGLFKSRPISTVIGWIKPDEAKELLTLSFGETWIQQTETIDIIINEVVSQPKNNVGLRKFTRRPV